MCYNFSNFIHIRCFEFFAPRTFFTEEKKNWLLFLSLIERKKETKKKRDLSIWISQMNASNAYDALSPNRNECIVERERGWRVESALVWSFHLLSETFAVSEGNGF